MDATKYKREARLCISSPRETQRYDSVGPVDPSAVIKGFDLSSVRPGIPRYTSTSGAAQNGRGEQGGAAHPPMVRLIPYLFPRSRCNIHRIEIDLELDILLDLLLDLLDLSRVSGLLSRISKILGKRNYFFK